MSQKIFLRRAAEATASPTFFRPLLAPPPPSPRSEARSGTASGTQGGKPAGFRHCFKGRRGRRGAKPPAVGGEYYPQSEARAERRGVGGGKAPQWGAGGAVAAPLVTWSK